MKRLLVLVLFMSGCVTGLTLKSGVGNEFRGNVGEANEKRYSVKAGVEAKLDNGMKVQTTYRNRITDFNSESFEHGLFLDVSVPLWEKGKGYGPHRKR